MRFRSCRPCRGDEFRSGEHRLPACDFRQPAENERGISLISVHCNRARVLPATAGWQPALPRSQTSVAEILEIGGNAKVAAAHELNHGLQVVFLFSRDANLSILQLALHFETL